MDNENNILFAEGYAPISSDDNSKIVALKIVADVDSAQYVSLEEAFVRASKMNAPHVTLLSDVEPMKPITIAHEGKIVFDLNGKNMKFGHMEQAGIQIKNGDVTVKNGNIVGGGSGINVSGYTTKAVLEKLSVVGVEEQSSAVEASNNAAVLALSGEYKADSQAFLKEVNSVIEFAYGSLASATDWNEKIIVVEN